MKRIKKILMIALLLSGIGIAILQAQTVSTVTLGGSQYPVVDLTELTPLGCVLTKKQCDERRAAMYASGVAPNQGSLISGNLTDEGWNKKMSSKFQVMKADYNSSTTMAWVDAWNGCKAYNGASDGGGSQAGQWRLPTQKEYKMIVAVYPQLLVQGIMSAFIANSYWIATEYNAMSAHFVAFGNGGMSSSFKTTTYRVRCVRDL